MYLRNRRGHPRQLLKADGWIADPFSDAWNRIIMLDISIGGFAFISKEKFDINVRRHFRVYFPGNPKRLNFEGHIRHCIATHAPPGYRFGVQFSHIDVADLATIEKLIDPEDGARP